MLSAPQIRKLLLGVLNEQIIPVLQAQVVPLVLVNPEYDFSSVQLRPIQKTLLPHIPYNPLDIIVPCDKAELVMRRMSLLGFGYSGASQENVGVTRQMAQSLKERNLPVPAGITALRLKAPIAFYVPARTPHSGMPLPEAEYGVSRILLVWFTEQEFWVQHCDAVNGVTHILPISAPFYKQLEQDYVRLLEQREFWAAQLVLLDFMKRLAAYLTGHLATMGNSAWPSLGDKAVQVAPHVSSRHARYCYQVIDYVQFHLHTPLSLERLARVCGVTAPYLSRVFRKSTGMTVMHYVTQSRLWAAELMLRDTGERISDIAKLAGFASVHSFDGIFRRAHGMSPSQYRRQSKQDSRTPA